MSRNSQDTRIATFPGIFRSAWVQRYGKATIVHNICLVSFTRIWFHSITLLTAYCCHFYYDLLLTAMNSSFPTVQILGFPSLPSCLVQALHFHIHIPSRLFYSLKWGLLTIN